MTIHGAYVPGEIPQTYLARGHSRRDEGGSPEKAFAPAPEPLPVPVMDNHTHLDFGVPGAGTAAAALDAAAAAGVQGAVQVGTDLESSREAARLAEEDPRLLAAVAIHPNDAPELAAAGSLEEALEEIEALAGRPRVRAVGETGLDYYRTGPEGVDAQQYSFRQHIGIARRAGVAVQIHDRDAHQDVVRILKEEQLPPAVVFHCFSGDAELARICNEHGWYMSFAGTVTFRNAQGIRDALSIADPSLILVETDAPFLTPHPYRGRNNASYMIPYTVRAMAEIRGADVADLCTSIAANTTAVYGSWG
ncbi:MAG: TatD family hydrolase [Arthrobacter sp.]